MGIIVNRDVGAHPNDEHDELDRGDWLPDYLHGGSSLYRNWDFRPSLDRDEGCQRIWWRAQFLNLFGATAFQDSHPEIFGFASGSGTVPLSGLDFFLDFSADPLNEQPHYQVILGTGGANPALPFGHMGSFLCSRSHSFCHGLLLLRHGAFMVFKKMADKVKL
jgi:hypothetical protein